MKRQPDLENFTGSWIAAMSGLVKQHGGINLAQGIPGYDPPEELIKTLKEIASEPVHQYPRAGGDIDLIYAIQQKHQQVKGLNDDQILVVQGATEGISLVYTLLVSQFGQSWTAVAFDPIYESYGMLPEIYGNRLSRISYLNGLEIDWEALEAEIALDNVRLVFVDSPGNPLARIWTREEIDRLLKLAQQHHFYVLLDVVYQDLIFSGDCHDLPFDRLEPYLIVVNSFSKMLSITGWRIGYLLAEAKVMKKLYDIHDYTGLCAPSVLQKAIARYMMENNQGLDYLSVLHQWLHESYQLMAAGLIELGFSFKPVDAGYFIWAALPDEGKTGKHFALELFDKQKISVVPGIHFKKSATNFVRINFARPKDELKQALTGLRSYLKR